MFYSLYVCNLNAFHNHRTHQEPAAGWQSVTFINTSWIPVRCYGLIKNYLFLRKVKSFCVSTNFFELLYSRCTVVRLYTGRKITTIHECTTAFGDYKLNRSLGDLHLSHDWKILVSTIARWHVRMVHWLFAHFSSAFFSFIDVSIEEPMSYNVLVKLT
jgi:hypothetical protein